MDRALRTWKLTSFTATSPPKLFVSLSTSSTSSRSSHSIGAADGGDRLDVGQMDRFLPAGVSTAAAAAASACP